MQEIDGELCRLVALQKKQVSIGNARRQAEKLSRSVPENLQLDRLIRYEVHLNRDLDRTLSQIERVQRMRLGQPPVPRIELDLKK
jgi:hypothetical protein